MQRTATVRHPYLELVGEFLLLVARPFLSLKMPVYYNPVSTITAILEPDADGTLHLPLPAELRHGKVKVEAKLEAAVQAFPDEETGSLKGFGALRGQIRMTPDFDEPLEDFKDYME